MRRFAALLALALLAAVLVVRRRRRHTPPAAPVAAPPPPAPAPEAPPASFVSVPWELVAAPRDRGELVLSCTCAEDMQLDRIDVQETPTQVFVTVLMRWRPPAGGWFAWEREQEAIARLSRPLGARELVHAPTDLPAGDEPYS